MKLSYLCLEKTQTHNKCLHRVGVATRRDKQRGPKGYNNENPHAKTHPNRQLLPLWHRNTKKEDKQTKRMVMNYTTKLAKTNKENKAWMRLPKNMEEKEKTTKEETQKKGTRNKKNQKLLKEEVGDRSHRVRVE